jgi:hypothetical protein
MLMVFAGLIHTVGNTLLIKRERKPLVERIDRWSRWVYPILMSIVILVSFAI